MKTLNKFWILASLLALSACAAFAPAQSFDQKLAYGYGTHTAVLLAAASSTEAGTLKVADAEKVLELADQSRRLLDAAKLASGAGDFKTAEGQLALSVNILTQLQNYLREQQK